MRLTVFSQVETTNGILEQRIEYIGEFSELEAIDLSNLEDIWNYYLDHPLNLNKTSEEDLSSLLLLNEFQIKDLLNHLKNNGKLLSIYELQSIPSWDEKTIQMILPFVEVSDKLNQPSLKLKDILKYGKFELTSRYSKVLEEKKGYLTVDSITNTNVYQGNDLGLYNRLRFRYRNNISLGITTQKDAGELIKFKDTQKGFDFYSAHFFYKGGKWLESFVLGDYQIEIGQGLNCWTGYAFGKTADVIQIKKSATPIRPYASSDESRFLRGAAVNLSWKSFSMLTFLSNKKIDGSIQELNGENYISSITQNGLHRTGSENLRRKRVGETIVGSDLKWKLLNLEIGVSNIYQRYDLPLLKDTVPYNIYDFRGVDLFNTSAYYSYGFKNIILFGEYVPKSKKEESALINGLLVALDKKSNLTLLYRNYGRAFHSFYNNSFSNGSKAQNENGIFIGYTNSINKKWHFNTYVDIYFYPWLKYQVDKPSKGNDVLTQLNYRPSKKTEVYIRFRQRTKEMNRNDSESSFTSFSTVKQTNVRCNFKSKVSEYLTLKARVELVHHDQVGFEKEFGILMYQDFTISTRNKAFKLTMRYALFETESYQSRVYAYENNVLGLYSIPAYYAEGSRVYGILKYHFLNKIDLWIKVGRNIYSNKEEIGSGLEEIIGNEKTDITFQLRLIL
jgi:hypothetical protein